MENREWLRQESAGNRSKRTISGRVSPSGDGAGDTPSTRPRQELLRPQSASPLGFTSIFRVDPKTQQNQIVFSSIEFIRGDHQGRSLFDGGQISEGEGNQNNVAQSIDGHTLRLLDYPKKRMTVQTILRGGDPEKIDLTDEASPLAIAAAHQVELERWLALKNVSSFDKNYLPSYYVKYIKSKQECQENAGFKA